MAGLFKGITRKLNPIRANLREPYDAVKGYYDAILDADEDTIKSRIESGELNSKKFETFVQTYNKDHLYANLIRSGYKNPENTKRAHSIHAKRSEARRKLKAVEDKLMKTAKEATATWQKKQFVNAFADIAAKKAVSKFLPVPTNDSSGTGVKGGKRKTHTRKLKKSKKSKRTRKN